MAALDGHGEDGGALGGGALAAAAAPAAPHLPPSGGSSALGGFLAGAALVLVLGALAWRRWRTSNRRELHRQRQHAALRELSAMDAQELRQLLGGLELPSWVSWAISERAAQGRASAGAVPPNVRGRTCPAYDVKPGVEGGGAGRGFGKAAPASSIASDTATVTATALASKAESACRRPACWPACPPARPFCQRVACLCRLPRRPPSPPLCPISMRPR